MKICTQCGQLKSLDQFYRAKRMADGHESWCKGCKKVYYQEQHRDKMQIPGYAESRVLVTTQWNKDHPEQFRAMHKAGCQNSRLVGLEGSWTAQQWEQVKRNQDYRCLACDRQEPDIQLTADHIIPISKPGSTNWIENIQGLCHSCNARKGARV